MGKQDNLGADAAFVGSTVISSRRDSAIPGVIIRRRQGKDGTRFTTYEVSEAMGELLLATPGGLVRRNTAINPENIAKAKALAESGRPRKECEAEMGVSSGTFRRLLAAAGVEPRGYKPIMTDDNVIQALKVSTKYNLANRKDMAACCKELGVNARTVRKLLMRAVSELSMEEIATIRAEARKEQDAATGQQSLVPDTLVTADGTMTPVTPETVNVAPAPEAPHYGDAGFVERRANPPVDPQAVSDAVSAAVAAILPAAVAAATHPTA